MTIMKKLSYGFILVLASLAAVVSCVDEPDVQFGLDTEVIEIGPEGGVRMLNVSSADNWIATVQEPWVTVSPANGTGTAECSIAIDSALSVNVREAVVRIENQVTKDRKEFTVRQSGFDWQIVLPEPEVTVADYAVQNERRFSVKVKTNVPFNVVLEEGDGWLSYRKPEFSFDRGARPRDVRVDFEWKVNYDPQDRDALVKFEPVDQGVVPALKDDLKVRQEAAEPIEVGIKGDSLAILAIHRIIGCWTDIDTSEKMEFWDGVELWDSGEHKGRVKRAEFYMFNTKESIPYQVKYLTAAEELYFFGNTNTFLLSLDPGEHICELENLRKLTIGAYGLSSLPESFSRLKNLEYLDISSNNFQQVPSVLTPENFPKLTALIMNACQRNTIYDLSNTLKTNYGGLFDESDTDADGNKVFPKRLLMWDNLDTLRLSVNYLEGIIPDLKDDPDFPKWTEEEVSACDTLPSILIGMPKVLPNTDLFAINLNRLHGSMPDWLLYHPKLDLWYPTSLVFLQEGKTSYGVSAGFDNEPANMDYYYEHYTKKKFNPANLKAE
ncbi:MAG: hypothetical protein E7113_02995 [Bacteroidales bacterium]|nr:hypothetical protein [Bacteroidales bacterium]